jgi:hypothetical protein
MKIRIIKAFMGVQEGTVKNLAADIARDLIERGLAEAVEESEQKEEQPDLKTKEDKTPLKTKGAKK